MAVLLMYNSEDSYTVEQIRESTQIKMVRNIFIIRIFSDDMWMDVRGIFRHFFSLFFRIFCSKF